MTKYRGEARNVSGTSGGGYVATGQPVPNDPRGATMSLAMGSVVNIARELPELQTGDEAFRKIRLHVREPAGCLRPGGTVCSCVFRHL